MKPAYAVLGMALLAPALATAVEFEKDILPIFEAKCSRCHMEGSSKGGVALDLDKIGREIGDGKAIVPGDSTGSDLYDAVSMPEGDRGHMPPEGKGRPLSDRELETLKEWIDAGAPMSGEGEDRMAEEDSDEDKPESSLLPPRREPLKGTWTNKEGKEIQATLLRVEGDKAVLQMPNAKIYEYPIAQLSDESQAIVKKWMEDEPAQPAES